MRMGTIVLTMRDAGRNADFVMDRPQTWIIGRADDCDLRLPTDERHAEVSRYHCQIEADPPQLRVRDLGSTNGTFVNGTLIGMGPLQPGVAADTALPAHEVSDGDEIRVGRTTFDVRISVAAEREETADDRESPYAYVPQAT